MPYVGAHLSIAGGLPRAIERAVASGCEALQIFTKSVGQWKARPLGRDEIAAFRRQREAAPLHAVVAHVSYLINLAAADPALRARSLAALLEEYDRAEALGLDGLVVHPGSYTTSDARTGLKRIASGIRRLLRARPDATARLFLEQTAGQGTSLGHRFDHLATILRLTDQSPRVGVCLDTCHLLAAGYAIHTERGYADTFREFDELVGLGRIALFHLNDSKRECDSRVDRHAHIGRGHVGLEGFARLVNDPRFAERPMILETPKGRPHGRQPDPADLMNLRVVRRLLKRSRARRSRAPVSR